VWIESLGDPQRLICRDRIESGLERSRRRRVEKNYDWTWKRSSKGASQVKPKRAGPCPELDATNRSPYRRLQARFSEEKTQLLRSF